VGAGATLHLHQLTVANSRDFDFGGGIRNLGTLTVTNRSYAIMESRIKKGIESPWGGTTLCLSHSG
jgi:hypothetical protein